MKLAEKEALTRSLAKFVLAEIDKRFSAIAARVAVLEGGSLKYFGVWSESIEYRMGAMVSHSGGLWHANVKTIGERPGASSSWTLAVKRGQPGKDAK